MSHGESNEVCSTFADPLFTGKYLNKDCNMQMRFLRDLLVVFCISSPHPGDTCWERRLRCVLRLFLLSLGVPCASPVILEIVTLPCLKILRGLITPAKVTSKAPKDGSPSTAAANSPSVASSPVAIDVRRWLRGEEDLGAAPASYKSWRCIALEEL